MTTSRAAAAVLLTLSGVAHAAAGYCEDPADARGGVPLLPAAGRIGPSALFDGMSAGNGMEQLAHLAREAVAGSAEARSAEHASLAAGHDLRQTEAARAPTVSLGGALGAGQSRIGDITQSVGGTGQASLSVSAPLYDGGRIDQLATYRQRLLDASATGIASSRERAVKDALITVIDRNRYRLQLRVYQQYVAKMGCLAQSLEKIVVQDRGRASELVQARKGLRQAELSREETIASLRQADARLRLIVAGNVAPWGAVGVPLLEVPELAQVMADVANSPEVRQLRLQADAQENLARATQAEGSPQMRWQVGANTGRAAQVTTSAWNAGLMVNYTLDDGGAIAAGARAATERAAAARRSQEALVTERAKLAGTYHDAARTSFQRAQHYANVLADSEQVRNATYEQWAKLGKRSLFDLMSAEAEHYQLRVSYVSALHDGFQASLQLRAAGAGLLPWLAPELAEVRPPSSAR
jgi:outer membrane protein, adhesin transport system